MIPRIKVLLPLIYIQQFNCKIINFSSYNIYIYTHTHVKDKNRRYLTKYIMKSKQNLISSKQSSFFFLFLFFVSTSWFITSIKHDAGQDFEAIKNVVSETLSLVSLPKPQPQSGIFRFNLAGRFPCLLRSTRTFQLFLT